MMSNFFEPSCAMIVPTMSGAGVLIEAIATKKSHDRGIVRSLQEIHGMKGLVAD
ncbi:MAG TPA: hypothetical protein VNB22_17270 [Pyrinomonadaceae bacterium]|jgi:hypothetical protein|nr:hypothetical protein [Pyrinomonadaceae bacterium]